VEYGQHYIRYGYPFEGKDREKTEEFLEKAGLSYDEDVEFTINIYDYEHNLVGTGSLNGKIIKSVAVDKSQQGTGLSADILMGLISHASEKFLFTKPENKTMFANLGFYTIAETADVLLMENIKNGIEQFIDTLERKDENGVVGAIVANCNPFTKGHLYLMETAARQCDFLHVFILSEDKSVFPTNVRFALAKEGTAHIPNLAVHHTSDYLISSVTFPTYFIKDKNKAKQINVMLDLTIFYQHFAKKMNISRRYVGTEPFCEVTNEYNIAMKSFLVKRGIEVIEIPRQKESGQEISASYVRKLMAEDNYEKIRGLVPETTYRFIISPEGRKIAEKLKND